jgi:hypothetical protein
MRPLLQNKPVKHHSKKKMKKPFLHHHYSSSAARAHKWAVASIWIAATLALVLSAAVITPLVELEAQSERALDAITTDLAETSQSLVTLQTTLYELALNITAMQSNGTSTATGTFEGHVLGSGDPVATGTYDVRVIELGGLNFTLLVLALDAGQAINLASFGASTIFGIRFDAFDPPVLLFSDGNVIAQDFSAHNVDRLYVDDACLEEGTCGYQAHKATTTMKFVSSNTVIAFNFLSPDRVLEVDTPLSFTSPLQLLVATI